MNSLLLYAALTFASCKALDVRAWKSEGVYPTVTDFPERNLKELASRPNTAISFSGGGSRSFAATIGYLAALEELDLMKNVRYISGISGGSWATASYMYSQNVTDDNVLLGPVVFPEDIVYEDLKYVAPGCVRSFGNPLLMEVGMQGYKSGEAKTLPEIWSYAVQKMYLEPIGITDYTRFSWSEEIVQDIKKRNPELENEKFLLPTKATRPFMILGAALVGPNEGAPYKEGHENYTKLEITPLYVGNLRTMDVSFVYNGWFGKNHSLRVGGAIETYAFPYGNQTEGVGPSNGLRTAQTVGELDVPSTNKFMNLRWATGSSGYAEGAFIESSSVFPDTMGMHFSYWSPTEYLSPKVSDMLITDGGCLENVGLITYLQRRVEKIIIVWNQRLPLKPSSEFNPYTDAPTDDQIDDSFMAYFGLMPPPAADVVERSFMYFKNQVFATEEYAPLVDKMQKAQAAGNGIIVSANLTTVENQWWGIPAGITAEITFVMLGRLTNWENQLSDEMRSMVIPKENGDNPSVTPDSGPFRKFPHYTTAGGVLNNERANLLADLTGWTVYNNRELFEHMLS